MFRTTLIALCLLAATVAAEEKITIEFQDTTLKDAAALISHRATVNIVVDPEVENQTITATFEDQPVARVIRRVADHAGAVAVWKDGVWHIGPPPTGQERSADAIRETLSATLVSVNFAKMSIDDALLLLGSRADATILLDPASRKGLSDEASTVTLELDNVTLRTALDSICQAAGLDWDVRWRLVFVATPARLGAVPKELFAEAPAEDEAQLLRRLSRPISFAFDETPVMEALGFIGAIQSLNFVVAPNSRAQAEKCPVSLTVKELPIRHALAGLLLPHGFQAHLEKNVVVVTYGPPAPPKRTPAARPLPEGFADKKVTLSFDNEPVGAAIDFLAASTGLPIRIDHELRADPDQRINLSVNDVAADDAVRLIVAVKKLDWDERWGGIFIAKADRLKELPGTTAPDVAADAESWRKALAAKLRNQEVNATLASTTLEDAVTHLSSATGVNIVFDPTALAEAGEYPVVERLTRVSLGNALSLLLVPRGLTWELKAEVVLVKKR